MTSNTAALLDTLAALPGYAQVVQAQERSAVGESVNLQRILAIPRRQKPHKLPGGPWHPNLDALAPADVTAAFSTPTGTWTLRPLQARALIEAARSRGLVGRLPVGRGKSLLALLLFEVLEAQRGLLLVPAALMGSLARETEKYKPHFKLPLHRIAKIMSHAELSLPSATNLLDTLQPDVVIIDEVDAFANRESVRTDRILKYGRRHPETRWGVLSGTVFQKSVRDAVYWFALALRERSPLPLNKSDVDAWAEALDPPALGSTVRHAGALHQFCEPGETPREGWNRRAADTVGVITAPDDRLGISLNIHERLLVMPARVQDMIHSVEETWQRPDGKSFWMALDLRRLERQLSAGFFYRWIEEPPEEWIKARKAWAWVVRQRQTGSRHPGMDSPFLIEQAAERAVEIDEIRQALFTARAVDGSFRQPLEDVLKSKLAQPHFDSPEWRRWRALRDAPEPVTMAVPVDDYLAVDAAQWGRENTGIIWFLHDWVGQRISALGGFPLFGAGEDWILDEKGDRTIVASIKAHGVGKNLQAFHKALVTELPASGQAWEQLCGRLHRDGQEAPAVDYTIYRHCPAYTRAWASAIRKARFMKDMNGNDQRMLYATKSFDDAATPLFSFTPEELEAMDGLGRDDDLTAL